ncbi:MAG: phosphatase PAP2 family protein [Clostridiales bacterium]|nr:phosphatase PAP2 family protein [Clostridiales bacterium]
MRSDTDFHVFNRQLNTDGTATLCKEPFIKKALPKYMLIPLIILIVGNLSSYYVPHFINVMMGRSYVNMSSSLDAKISVLPVFTIIYVLAFPFWYLITYYYLRKSSEHAFRFSLSNISAKITCAVIFILIPSTLVRPDLTGTGLSVRLLSLIYKSDAPTNLFPSIHCLESWFCFRCIYDERGVPRIFKAVSFLFAILICMSTVFTKQHVLLDIPAGIFVAELFWRLNSLHPIRRFTRKLGRLFL